MFSILKNMTVLIRFLLCILFCNYVKSDIFPEGHKWTYSYKGFVYTGSVLPTEVISRWELCADLEITAKSGGAVLAQLKNFQQNLYNGPMDAIPENLKSTDLHENASTILGNPFQINYDGDKIQSLYVNENDDMWAVNMKKAIASLLQLNTAKLSTSVSTDTENNIHGNCDVEYSVETDQNDTIYLRKNIDSNKCQNYSSLSWSSTPYFYCDYEVDDPLMAGTVRDYVIRKKDKHFQLEKIVSQRKFYSQPFKAGGEIQQSYSYQELRLLEKTTPESDAIVAPTNFAEKNLIYEHNLHDLAQGRFVEYYTQEDVIIVVNALLDEVVNNLDEKNLDTNIVEFHRELMFLYYNMYMINKESYEKFYGDLSVGTSYKHETKRSIFLELLPQVGSEFSVKFVKHLVTDKKLNDITIVKLLSMFPFYVKEHSEAMLKDMEILMTLQDKYDNSVRHTAILSFATLVYQTYTAGKCSQETFDNYVVKYFNLFSESKTYEKQMLYLQALDNLQLSSAPKYLESIVRNKGFSHHLRHLAIWGAIQTVSSRAEESYETYWPIFANKTEHLELRTASLLTLLVAQPSKARLLSIFWALQAENNPHLYNFFYTLIVSSHKSTYPCLKQISMLARNMIRFLPVAKEQKWMTGVYLLDYRDDDKAFGNVLQLTSIANPDNNTPNVVFLSVQNYANKFAMNQIALYLKLQGVGNHLSQVLNQTQSDLNNLSKLVKLLNIFNSKVPVQEQVHIELTVKIRHKNSFTIFIDGKTLEIMSTVMQHAQLFTEFHLNHQSIVVPYIREHMEPTDLGTLLIKAVVSNSIASTRGSFNSEKSPAKHEYKSDIDFRFYTYTTSFLELFNPISAMWHGVERGKKLQTKLNVNGTLITDYDKNRLEFIENRDGDKVLSVLLHAHSYTYLVSNGSGRPLQHHCPKCSSIYNITQGPVKEKIPLIDTSLDVNESKLKLQIFDCDKVQDIRNVFFELHKTQKINAEILPLVKPLLYFMYYYDYISFIPSHGRCGAAFSITSNLKEPHQINYVISSEDLHKFNDHEIILSSGIRKNSTKDFAPLWKAKFAWNLKSETDEINLILSILDPKTKDRYPMCLNTMDRNNPAPLIKPINANLIVQWDEPDKVDDDSLKNCTSVNSFVNKSIHKIIKLLNDKLEILD